MIRTKYEIPKTRNKREVSVAHWRYTMDKHNKTPVNALYHKTSAGHILVALNKFNKPVRAWCDFNGIAAIKMVQVSSEKFSNIIDCTIKPKILYLNDGEHLHCLDNKTKVVYTNSNLYEILKELEENTKQEKHTDNKQNSLGNIPSYADMKILEPQMTHAQYKRFIKQLR